MRTSLIIAPSTICRQWYEELKRHVRADIKVDVSFYVKLVSKCFVERLLSCLSYEGLSAFYLKSNCSELF